MKLLKELDKDNRDKILGLLLCAFALLLIISLISYDFQGDHSKIRALFDGGDLGSVFSGLNNRGGIVGAVISFFLYVIFGYFAVLIPFGCIVWGINRFFGKPTIAIRRWAFISSAFVLAIMTFLSLPSGRETGSVLNVYPGGAIGHFIARALLALFGTVFSYALAISLIITGLIFVIPSLLKKVTGFLMKLVSTYPRALFLVLKSRMGLKLAGEKETKAELRESRGFLSGIIRIKKKKSADKIEEAPLEAVSVETDEEDSIFEGDRDKAGVRSGKKLRKDVRLARKKDGYRLPTEDMLRDAPPDLKIPDKADYRRTAEALRHTLLTFGVDIDAGEVNIFPGPVITRFEFKPASGIKVSQITNLADDLALAMQAERIRIVAPIPGKSAVGVEIPNRTSRNIYLKEILSSRVMKESDAILPLALGLTISGEPFSVDLASMPHLLIAGSTGSGKSVCLNCIINSLIYNLHPEALRFILIDPKRLELSVYDGLPHLERAVVTDIRDAEKFLGDAVLEMEDRYRRLARAGVRNIIDYNRREKEILPFIVIIVDELADMMMSGLSRMESLITRLAQMARAVGIHLVLATQRPSVDVITGLIKANFSTRIAFQTATKVDSRTILDANGAEKLLGKGDMLFSRPGLPEPVRIHGAYISGDEIEQIVEFIGEQEYRTRPIETFEKSVGSSVPGFDPATDPLYREAVELVIRHKQGSVSLLQRRLGIGYQRAARLIDQLENNGIVGPYDGSKAREVLVNEAYLESEEFKK
ncbi:MAG: DNA translocase FtsK [Candidatus Zixiibacteriota bacterium]|nr:MAG: DNA translocase FtsK [candidate division Zixibacteria bacterium]